MPNNTYRYTGTLKELWRVSLPMSISVVASNLLWVVDTMFVSRWSETSLAALGICTSLHSAFFIVLFALSIALQIRLSEMAGRGIHGYDVFTLGVATLIACATLLTLVGVLTLQKLLGAVISSTSIQQEAHAYLSIRFWDLPFHALFLAGRALLISGGRTVPLGVYSAAMTVMNALLDWWFIFGGWGLAPLGFRGAALASVASVAICSSAIFVYTLWRTGYWRLQKPSIAEVRAYWRLATPLIPQYLTALSGWVAFFLIVEKLGEFPLAVSNITNSILSLVNIFTWTFPSVISAMVSNLKGQGQMDKIIGVVWRATLSAWAGDLLLLGGLLVGFGQLMALYTEDTTLKQGVQHLLPNIILITLAAAPGTIFFNAVAGTGKTTLTWMIESVAVMAYVGFCWWAVFTIRVLPVVWLSEAIYWAMLWLLSGVALFLILRKRKFC